MDRRVRSLDVEDFRFFDALDCFENSKSSHAFDVCTFNSDVWIHTPQSTQERRNKFLDWLENPSPEMIDRISERSPAVLSSSTSCSDDICSNGSLKSCNDLILIENSACQRNSNDYSDHFGDDSRQDVNPSSTSDKNFRKSERDPRKFKREFKNAWLRRLGILPCFHDRPVLKTSKFVPIQKSKTRIHVKQNGKKLKELSSLYMWQEIFGHNGSILAMKFSPDGHYLASAGKDGVVRLWQVEEEERWNVPETDPTCLYFTVNHVSKIEPMCLKTTKAGKSRRKLDSACVVFPRKVFHILDKPLHEFHGHTDDILDLSWSKNNHLVSSSVDKTVRMWQVGSNHCLKVFQHNNYVTCVQFHPLDENYLISGSIDGKVRIWAVSSCQVVDWTDINEIVTSVCYFPDGKGGVVGSLTGDCRFYSVSDNHLKLDCQICLGGKKKSPGKRITGLQFLTEDASKVMVTCADSQIRILQGNHVICKYKGIGNAGSQLVASLTSDGKTMISTTEGSTVCVWNSAESNKRSIRSHEHFSTNASIAIPWCGLKPTNDSPKHLSLERDFLSKGSATWPEEKLPPPFPLLSSKMSGSQYKFVKSSCRNACVSNLWGMVIVTGGWDGRIRTFHNYGLPVSI